MTWAPTPFMCGEPRLEDYDIDRVWVDASETAEKLSFSAAVKFVGA